MILADVDLPKSSHSLTFQTAFEKKNNFTNILLLTL